MEFKSDTNSIWIMYAFGTLIYVLRVFLRTKSAGIRGYQPDDYLIWLNWVLFTALSSLTYFFLGHLHAQNTSLLTAKQRADMSAKDVKTFATSSKIFLAALYCYIFLLWSLKFTLLFFYQRLVRNLRIGRAILPVMGLYIATGIAVFFAHTITCVPFRKLWQVNPDPGALCAPQNHVNFYTTMISAIVTDFAIWGIPIPAIIFMHIGIWRKTILCVLVSGGLALMIGANLFILLGFVIGHHGEDPTLSQQAKVIANWTTWLVRNGITATVVTQVPIIYPILKKSFWQAGYKTGRSSAADRDTVQRYELGNLSHQQPKDLFSITQIGISRPDRSDSQEGIYEGNKAGSMSSV